MGKIIDKIKGISKLIHLKGCTNEQIENAEKELNIKFPQEYIEYVKEYGVISFYGTEWTGLNVEGYLNTVEATKQEKNVNRDFPQKCFVIENLNIDAKIVIANEIGEIFLLQRNSLKFLCGSLSEYLEICIERNSK